MNELGPNARLEKRAIFSERRTGFHLEIELVLTCS